MNTTKSMRCVWHVLWAMVAMSGPATSASAAQTPVPVSVFFSEDAMSEPVLSPSGKHLAVRLGNADGRRVLAVINLDPPRQAKVVAAFSDADIASVEWVNDERLVFNINDLQSAFAYGFAPGLFAVDRTGENLRSLVKRQWQFVAESTGAIESRELQANHQLLRVLRDGSDDVVIGRMNFDHHYREILNTTPMRLNTRTGRANVIVSGIESNVRSWMFDEAGRPRAVRRIDAGVATVHWRIKPDAPWEIVSKGPTFDRKSGGFVPWSIGPDGQMYAVAMRPGEDRTDALFRFDATARRLESEPVIGLQGYDFTGGLIFDHRNKKLLGVRYTTDATETAWFDADMKVLQGNINQRLQGLINLLDVPECACSRWVVVTSYSDRQSPVYSIYDRETDQLERVGQARPTLDPRRMALRDFQRIEARDGLSFPVHLTRPSGKGPWPTVVLVHGGPYVRGGSWAWSADSQFLASRGYLVVEPEFRGSTGYGDKLFRAGWKQWGLGMQDDVADATRWAIAQGLADPKRVCIAGGSYGGYATLMGLIRDPTLYRCGVAWAGVTDLNLLYDLGWSDLPEVWKDFGMPLLIGDQVKDAEQLAATSPLKLAPRVTQPLLLAHGGADRRVPIQHGTKLRDAVSKTNKEVEWIAYDNEGHGWNKPENRYDFWTRVEKFLAKQLAPQ